MFKSQLIRLEEKIIKDSDHKDVTYKVAIFTEISNKYGIELPTGVIQKKWIKYNDEESKTEYAALNLKVGNYYAVDISFALKVINVTPWDDSIHKLNTYTKHKIQLIGLEDKFIKDKKHRNVMYKVAKFNEVTTIDGLNISTENSQNKWFKYDDEESKAEYAALSLQIGKYYNCNISFDCKLINISLFDETEQKLSNELEE